MSLKTEIERLIDIAVQEDLGMGDVTSNACTPEEKRAMGSISLKQTAIVAGLPYLEHLFHKIDPQIQVTPLVEEGSQHKAGTILAEIHGPVRGLLAGERVVLNFLQYVSGIATVTGGYVRKVAGYPCAILATRATIPGLRPLAQYGVITGGGTVHRYSLDEKIIIKRNHLALLSGCDKPITEAFLEYADATPTLISNWRYATTKN